MLFKLYRSNLESVPCSTTKKRDLLKGEGEGGLGGGAQQGGHTLGDPWMPAPVFAKALHKTSLSVIRLTLP